MPKITTRPYALTTGLLLYLVLDIAVFGVAAFSLFGEGFRGEEAVFGSLLGGVLTACGIVILVETWRASRGRRSARKTLTYLSILLAVLYVWRRLLPILLLAVLGAVALVFVWLPASEAYYQRIEPKRKRIRGYASATKKAAGVFRKK
ncbi:hypothetical protein [Falsarthrobacter nasiphocae]|uniref:Chromate transport protein ChrA n=1 Tax=Falsarthrobacter nasiphocae TaxID=189863 RepID=A0AAE4C8J5_9MICC|nr:hypothetical protein [Falsarthrobacter nasiphocae]MDR6892480.1 chromate transport protein ChrA [Falsarthrobacter nasiphocae]